MASESPRKRLPFEPGGKGSGKSPKAAPSSGAAAPAAQPSVANAKVTKAGAAKAKTAKASASRKAAATAIPEAVSSRMLRRMLAFSGTPTVLGVLTFFVSYYLVVNDVVELPSYFVLFITLGFFGLGVVGLTYGVLSASWDEDRPGNLLGLNEFQVNFGRMTSAWRSKADR